MALIHKHFEEVLGDIGVIKLWTTKFLGIPVYKKESLSERVSEISAFQSTQRNMIGFKTSDESEDKNEETEDKGESSGREVSSGDNSKRRIYRFKIKRKL